MKSIVCHWDFSSRTKHKQLFFTDEEWTRIQAVLMLTQTTNTATSVRTHCGSWFDIGRSMSFDHRPREPLAPPVTHVWLPSHIQMTPGHRTTEFEYLANPSLLHHSPEPHPNVRVPAQTHSPQGRAPVMLVSYPRYGVSSGKPVLTVNLVLTTQDQSE